MMKRFPALPTTTLEALAAMLAGLTTLLVLVLTGHLEGEVAAQMAAAVGYGALAAWNRGVAAPTEPPTQSDGDQP